jgi:Skp family chaperone for outer membrane proteins
MKHLTAFMAMMALGWCTGPLCAQTASAREWFDRAAQEFVQQDKITALRTLDKGLREHPNDPRLTKLAEALLKEDQQQKQQQQQQQQGGSDDKQQEQQRQQQQGQDQRSREQQQQQADQTFTGRAPTGREGRTTKGAPATTPCPAYYHRQGLVT